MRVFHHLFLFFLIFHRVSGAQEHIVLRSKPYGMFSMFHHVLYYLQKYEQQEISGFHVDFADTGIYYKKELGSNWWEYYFEPINLEKYDLRKNLTVIGVNDYVDQNIIEFEFCSTKEDNHFLINKYIRIKPHILNKIHDFWAKNLRGCMVIGIHYRGTDKICESNRVPYNEIADRIQKMHSNFPLHQNFKIFIATDEYLFLHYMIYRFGDRICYIPSYRSVDGHPVHYDQNADPYQNGEDALIDCLLLSKANILLRTSSNLSLCSTYFNPFQKVIELSQRHNAGEAKKRCIKLEENKSWSFQ